MSRSVFHRVSVPIALLAAAASFIACSSPHPGPLGGDASLPDASDPDAPPPSDGGGDGDAVPGPDPTACDPEPDGGAPRPIWTQQPNRITPTVSGSYSSTGIPISNSDGGVIGGIVACDPTKLGQYPKAEGGNPNPKGADLQNITTNFHALQSLELLASVASKAVSKLNQFQTDVGSFSAKGVCVCNTVSTSCQPATKNTREDCDTACAGSCGGVKNWVSTDVFLQNNGNKKWAMKTLGLLDGLKDLTTSPTFTAITNALSAFGAAVENQAEILAKAQCWIDLFSEGYHLGGYDTQRPDLHMCVGYYGHGAYAGIAENDRFDIGGRYTSHNLSKERRAQMRTGGWGITAFGRNLSILPNFELNTQIDGYKFFDKCHPLGLDIGGDPSVGCPGGAGFWVGSGAAPSGTIDADKVDVFQLVDKAKLKKLDSDGNDIITAGEFIVAGYHPFQYPNAMTGPYQWPRSTFPYDWESSVSSVLTAGLNLDPHITPIEKILGTYTIYPGVVFVPKLTLKAGADWKHEAYLQRQRLLTAINKNLAPSLQWQVSSFERNMHPMQAPDVSGDTGVSAYVTPGVQAQLTVGLVLSKWLEIGISAFIGMELDIRPGAYGGILDASLPLVSAINSSNPPDGPCSPVLETKTRTVCSDTLMDTAKPTHSDPSKSYSCKSSAEEKGSCCVKFKTEKTGEQSVCIDAWTGIKKDYCDCPSGLDGCYEKIKPYVISAKAREMIENALSSGTVSSISMSWNDTKTCAECAKDKTCPTPEWARTPELLELSDCSRHGYCVPPTGDTIYDVTEDACTERKGQFYRYQCVDQVSTEITKWEGPGCHPLNSGFPSACGCSKDGDCATGETCSAGKCTSTPATCACDPADAASCGAGRTCVDGACVKSCVTDGNCRDGFKCTAGKCVSSAGTPYAEQIVWQTAHPSTTGPQHSVETYALTDLQLKMILDTGIRIGATIKLFKKPRDFLIWAWSKAWDLGSRQKAKFQPGLESSYLTECSSSVGNVTNHQPGAAAGITCSGGDNKVCRYPDASSPTWSSYDDPSELLAVCKDTMPGDVEDPIEPQPGDFGDSMTNLTDFGLDVGQSQWNAHQLCVGEKGVPLVDWLKNPSEINGSCTYKGTTPGAPASFPCKDLEKYSMEIWGCLNTTSGAGLTAKNILLSHGLDPHTPDYLVTPTYASSLTSTQVFDLHALVPDPWATPSTAVFDPAVWSVLSPIEQIQMRQWLASVEQCYDAAFQKESACKCATATDCAAGNTCSGGSCQTPAGNIAVCPFLEFGKPADVHPCCGDGVVTASVGEQCDDGNTVSGDGCNLECKSERKGGACCLPSGCADMTGTAVVEECKKKGGSAFFGKTCKELNYCGHPTTGSCTGPDGICHQPATEQQCSAIKGTFSTAGCGK